MKLLKTSLHTALFATITTLFIALPGGSASSVAEAPATPPQPKTQIFTASPAPEPILFERASYTVEVIPKPEPPAPEPAPEPESTSSSAQAWTPPVVTPDPGSAQEIAYGMVMERGWGEGEFGCLVALWNRESGWNVTAYNASSGAYGIPQSLPGNKMAAAGADWETNPSTQITWGLNYISGRYGAPCGAWAHSENKGWY